MKYKSKNNFLIIFLFSLFLFSVFKIYNNSINLDAWQYGEWVINYQAGFVRRGLFGEIIYNLSYLFKENIIFTTIFLVTLICLIYYCLLYRLLKKIEINFIWLLFFFSPLIFFFIINTNKIGIHKITILYSLYIYFLIIILENKMNFKNLILFYFSFLILLFIYEGYFFYLPYFIIPILEFLNKSNKRKYFILFIIFFVLSLLIMIIIYNNKGNLDTANTICNSLGSYAPIKCNWWGAIGAFSLDYSSGIQMTQVEKKIFDIIPIKFYMHADIKSYFGLIVYLLYSLIPFFIYFYFFEINKKYNISLIKIFSILILFSLPLFHIAEDWLRWVSYQLNMLFYLICFFTIKHLMILKNNSLFKKIEKKLRLNLYRKLFIVFLILYPIFLNHPHFFWKGVRLEFTIIKVLDKNFNKIIDKIN